MARPRGDPRRFVFDTPCEAIEGYRYLEDRERRYKLYRCDDGKGDIAFVWARAPREALGRAAARFGVAIDLFPYKEYQ